MYTKSDIYIIHHSYAPCLSFPPPGMCQPAPVPTSPPLPYTRMLRAVPDIWWQHVTNDNLLGSLKRVKDKIVSQNGLGTVTIVNSCRTTRRHSGTLCIDIETKEDQQRSTWTHTLMIMADPAVHDTSWERICLEEWDKWRIHFREQLSLP